MSEQSPHALELDWEFGVELRQSWSGVNSDSDRVSTQPYSQVVLIYLTVMVLQVCFGVLINNYVFLKKKKLFIIYLFLIFITIYK